MKYIQVIGLIVGVTVLAWLVVDIGFVELVRLSSQADILCIFLALCAYLLSILIRAIKLNLLLRSLHPSSIGFGKFFPVYCIVHLIGNLTPVRSGESAGGPIFFKKYFRYPYGAGFAAMLVDTCFEASVLFLGSIFAVLYLFLNNWGGLALVQAVKGVATLFAIVISVVVLLFIFKRKTIELTKRALLYHLADDKFLSVKEFFSREIQQLVAAFRMIRANKVITVFVPLTLLSWVLDIGRTYLILSAIADYEAIHVLVAFMLTAVFSFLTLIPLGIGSAEVGWVVILHWLGYESSPVLVSLMVSRILFLVVLLVISTWAAIFLNRRYGNTLH